MAIKFGGEFEVKRTPEEVYDFLTDPQKFAPLLPDFQSMTQQDRDAFHGEGERRHFLYQGRRRREDGTDRGRASQARAVQRTRQRGRRKCCHDRRL